MICDRKRRSESGQCDLPEVLLEQECGSTARVLARVLILAFGRGLEWDARRDCLHQRTVTVAIDVDQHVELSRCVHAALIELSELAFDGDGAGGIGGRHRYALNDNLVGYFDRLEFADQACGVAIDEILRHVDFACIAELLHNDGIELRASVLCGQRRRRKEKTGQKKRRREAFHGDHLSRAAPE